MDESDVKWSLPELREVGHKDCHVRIYEQYDQNAKKDSRSKEPFKNLEKCEDQSKLFKRWSGNTQVIAHAAMTKFASIRG